MQIPLILAVTVFFGAMAYPGHGNTVCTASSLFGYSWFTDLIPQRGSSESNNARSIAGRGRHCRDGSIVDPTTHTVLDRSDDDTGLSDRIGSDDDSIHNIDERSDTISGSSTVASNAEPLPDRETPHPTHISPSQMPLWHDMAILANSTHISQPEENNSHGLGYAALKLMCRASRKVVAIGSIMVIGYGQV